MRRFVALTGYQPDRLDRQPTVPESARPKGRHSWQLVGTGRDLYARRKARRQRLAHFACAVCDVRNDTDALVPALLSSPLGET